MIVAACSERSIPIHHYLYLSAGDVPKAIPLLKRPEVEGLQVVYNWNSLERFKGRYDFSEIEQALSYLEPLHKRLFIQIQDRFFSPDARNVPSYLLNEAVYKGGIVPQKDNAGPTQPEGIGWVAQQWNPAVRERYQRLIQALAAAFDGRVFGINLPETSADIDMKQDSTGFDYDKYFKAEMENIEFTRKVFKKSYVVQYVNFFLYKGRLPLVAMAVQEPTLTYINPETGKPFTRDEFISFAESYLGVNIIFWSLSASWLQLPMTH